MCSPLLQVGDLQHSSLKVEVSITHHMCPHTSEFNPSGGNEDWVLQPGLGTHTVGSEQPTLLPALNREHVAQNVQCVL